jgi:hypothetical protein
MYSFQGPEHQAPRAGQDDDEPQSRLDAIADEMLANQTPRQRELAERIWDRFAAGDDVDDVRDLIAELSRAATEDARNRREVPRAGGLA